MRTPIFQDEADSVTFEPFTLVDNRSGRDPDVRLAFYDFYILVDGVGLDTDEFTIDGNLMGDIMIDIIDDNDLIEHKVGQYTGGYIDNCEMDTCYFHFNHLVDGIRVAEFCIELFADRQRLTELLKSHGFFPGEAEDD